MKTWMTPENLPDTTCLIVFRCRFEAKAEGELDFLFSADNHAQLFLDGDWLMDGPERGAREWWYYQRAKISLTPGQHTLTARVVVLDGDLERRQCAYGQMSVRPGLFIQEETGLLKNWEYQMEDGCEFMVPFPDWGVFPRVRVSTAHNSAILAGQGGEWRPVHLFEDMRELHAPDLPLMRHEETVPVQKSPGLLYFPHYTCAWAFYRFTGHGTVRIRWAETPYLTKDYNPHSLTGVKGRRNGTFLVGNYDVFEVDGALEWHDFWWRAGHYVEIKTEGDVQCEPHFFQTGYPYPEYHPRTQLEQMAFETLQACSFETYMDCPYYEQLMYVGDSRLEALVTYRLFTDHRLPAKALRMLSLSQREDGALNAQYPSCSDQKIPSFMLIWLLMLDDYCQRHGNDQLVQELRPRAIRLLDYLAGNTSDGLLQVPGWNFIDWCQEWKSGTPPCQGPDSVLNWFYVLALQRMAAMQMQPGLDRRIEETVAAIRKAFYDQERGMYAIDQEHRNFSEHSQVLALLAIGDTSVIPALKTGNLIQCSIYFSYYYLAACRQFGLDDLFEKRLDRWRTLMDEGLTTFPEEFDNPRSDCHAWSSHILCFLEDTQQ